MDERLLQVGINSLQPGKRDVQAQDFVGAFEYGKNVCVPGDLFIREFAHESVAGCNLSGFVRGALNGVAGEDFADRGLDGRIGAAGVDIVSCIQVGPPSNPVGGS